LEYERICAQDAVWIHGRHQSGEGIETLATRLCTGFRQGAGDDRVSCRRIVKLEIVHRLLREERVTFDGKHYRLRDAPGLRRERLPIVVGGSATPGTAVPAARFANEYNTFSATVADAQERKRALDKACERVDRDPSTLRYSVMASCVIGLDETAVRESARRIGERFGGRSVAQVFEEARDRGPVGTVEQAAEWLRAVGETGCERVILKHLLHDDLETVELIGRELAPLVP
jgi:alkanesulfonate monooxygenase SsuD/methylene tetrahydromethanopterin reductase-like flavin-dependent oxidoreductase (luciferase family)